MGSCVWKLLAAKYTITVIVFCFVFLMILEICFLTIVMLILTIREKQFFTQKYTLKGTFATFCNFEWNLDGNVYCHWLSMNNKKSLKHSSAWCSVPAGELWISLIKCPRLHTNKMPSGTLQDNYFLSILKESVRLASQMNHPAGVKYAVHSGDPFSKAWLKVTLECCMVGKKRQKERKAHVFTYFESLFSDSIRSVDSFIIIFLVWDSVAAVFQLACHHSLNKIHLVGCLNQGWVKLGGDAGKTIWGRQYIVHWKAIKSIFDQKSMHTCYKYIFLKTWKKSNGRFAFDCWSKWIAEQHV